MGWEFGIPDFLGPYTYFRSLNDSLDDLAAERKRNLYSQAMNYMQSGLDTLTDVQKLKAANDFIVNVATSERGKELAAIQAYCKDMKTDIPALKPQLDDPQKIYNNPQEFYTILTTAINEIRQGSDDFLRELKRIKKNLEQQGRTIDNYRDDDYRYKLEKNISSFLHRLSGNYVIREDLNEFDLKIQNMTINILKEMNIGKQIASGEDFAAIATSVLADVEAQVQKEFDNSQDQFNTLEEVTDDILQKVEQRYLKELSTKKVQSPVQQALININGIDFIRITQNAKQLLNIQTIDLDEKKLTSKLKKIQQHDEKNDNLMIQNIRNFVTDNSLSKDLSLIDFAIQGSANTRHGTINEFILSAVGTNVRKNVGTDIITYKFNWKTSRNKKAFDTLINNIGEQFSSVITSDAMHSPANIKDLRATITKMNEEVDKLVAKTEEQLQKTKEGKTHDLFIFHETLKLYSSVETGLGEHKGFGGRNMNILSYIDYLNSASSVGVSNNINRDVLAFFARNLINGAIADDQKGPLEKYFSIFAGMIMFDDVVNMAKEAVSEINNSNNVIGGKVRQIHLYNLNGIYVPASLILSYVSDAINKASGTVMTDFISATISVSNSGSSSKSQKRISYFKETLNTSDNLTEQDWNDVASAAVASTKVQIIFLAAFEDFINKLFSFSM